MYEELIKRLRTQADAERYFTGEKMLYDEAADAIEELSKRVPPVPHGRLIDADAIDTSYSDPEVIETLQDAPTIIPASGGKEDE